MPHYFFSFKNRLTQVNYLCKAGKHQKIYYLWRPLLKDPYDDHILEVAVAASADFIVTFNTKDFTNVNQFGIKVVTPDEFLKFMGVKIWVH